MSLLRHFAVWEKAHRIPGVDHWVERMDDYGHRIRLSDYGDRDSLYGWEVDHHPIPKAAGGSDSLANLRPLHCKQNAYNGGLLGQLRSRPPSIFGALSPRTKNLFGH